MLTRSAFFPIATAILLLAAAGPTLAQGGQTPEQMADEVFALLLEAREQAGLGALERRPELSGVARGRAKHVAALPHSRRLQVRRSIGEDAREAGCGPFLRIKLHQDLNRGAQYPASSFFQNWQRYSVWATAMDPDFDAVGMGVARGEDGWMVLVAVFFEDMPIPADLPALEQETIAGVNRVRMSQGLSELVTREWLSGVARRHSEDMARQDYVDHRSPDGRRPADRVKAAGKRYRKLSENIYMGSGMTDPAGTAVEAWMNSKGHRKAIETPGFEETGMGIAVDARGRVYFTQLFYTAAN